MTTHFSHDLPFGAQLIAPGRVRFRVWAPGATAAAVDIIGRDRIPMRPQAGGWFEVELDCEVGAQYRYAFQTGAEGEVVAPDPASRGQAGDVFDPSMVVDAQAYAWRHPNWCGRPVTGSRPRASASRT